MNYLDIKLDGIDKNGEIKEFKLADFSGKTIILYFYPQDNTPVCTKEAQSFRDNLEKLPESVVVIGVSRDSIQDHLDFQKEHSLNYILLADTENKLKHAIVENERYIQNLHRGTFILDENGKIIKYWDKVDVDDHIEEVLEYINQST